MVQKIQDYDPTSETLTLEEGRKIIRRSGLLLFLGWEINSSFLLDQIRKEDKSFFFEDTNLFGETKVVGFNIDEHARVVIVRSSAGHTFKVHFLQDERGEIATTTEREGMLSAWDWQHVNGQSRVNISTQRRCERYVNTYLQERAEVANTLRRSPPAPVALVLSLSRLCSNLRTYRPHKPRKR